MHLFSTPQVAKILGLPLRKVISYTERGYLEASAQLPRGHGTKRLWTRQDITKILVIRKCESLGLSVRLLRTLADFLIPERLAEWPWIAIDENGDISDPRSSLEDFANWSEDHPFVYISLHFIRVKREELIKNAGLTSC
jgi:DNA-binding transcriptional MerR regulator